MANRTQRYEGSEITVCFDASRCIHAGNCVRGLPDVFRPDAKGAWINPDASSTEEIAALIESCPSGALQYEAESGKCEAAPVVNSVTVEADGPLTVHANFTIDGAPHLPPRATLCRCGASKNKPWCDGSHSEAGFKDAGDVAAFNPNEQPQQGVLDIRPLKHGPLYLVGPQVILDAAGNRARICTKSALCRCGASKNKPYCDGSHAAVGFRSD